MKIFFKLLMNFLSSIIDSIGKFSKIKRFKHTFIIGSYLVYIDGYALIPRRYRKINVHEYLQNKFNNYNNGQILTSYLDLYNKFIKDEESKFPYTKYQLVNIILYHVHDFTSLDFKLNYTEIKSTSDLRDEKIFKLLEK